PAGMAGNSCAGNWFVHTGRLEGKLPPDTEPRSALRIHAAPGRGEQSMGDAQSDYGEIAARGSQFGSPGGRSERWQQLGATIWICLPATALNGNSRGFWH